VADLLDTMAQSVLRWVCSDVVRCCIEPCPATRRRSIVISKSLAMIERRVALFAHLHVNKEAAPEMYRLPIQNAGFSQSIKMQY
jgi:hypothetical protein